MLYLEKNSHNFIYSFPAGFYNREVLEYCLLHCIPKEVNASLKEEGETLTLAMEGISDELIRRFFGTLNCAPFFNGDIAEYESPAVPLLSCVILLTANDAFVKNYLIPSILHNTKDFPVEIIIVYNGAGADLEQFKNFKVVHSEFGCVPKAYNAGVREAKGEYIAILHDDCIINDSGWMQKSIELLNKEGVSALTAEIQQLPELGLINARGVPLVMKRDEYWKIGGHDEYYYGGIEDIDFTYQIISRGKRIEKLCIDYRHYNGMSTVIMLSPSPALFKSLFAYNMLPRKTIQDFRGEYLGSGEFKELFGSVTAGSLLYFTDKFKPYFSSLKEAGVLTYRSHWENHSPGKNREELKSEIISTYSRLVEDKNFNCGSGDVILELEMLQF
jgi:glycosyltransferase involved in cell wall biosynthesis